MAIIRWGRCREARLPGSKGIFLLSPIIRDSPKLAMSHAIDIPAAGGTIDALHEDQELVLTGLPSRRPVSPSALSR